MNIIKCCIINLLGIVLFNIKNNEIDSFINQTKSFKNNLRNAKFYAKILKSSKVLFKINLDIILKQINVQKDISSLSRHFQILKIL